MPHTAVIGGVDVVAHNGARLSVSLRAGCMRPLALLWRRCWWQHREVGGVVGQNIDAGVGWDDDRRIGGKPKAANKISSSTK
jgi:hypothetical protein